MAAVSGLVEAADEIDCFQILAPAVAVRNPFSRAATVVEIKHRCDGVDSKAVDTVHTQPKQRVGKQIIRNFVATIVEDAGVPVGMKALPGIGVLVEMRAVETRQAVLVVWEMPGNPIREDPDAHVVRAPDEPAKILRRPETARHRVEA